MQRQGTDVRERPGQEHVTMTAEPPGRPVTEGVRSLEVRWIFPGQLETAVAEWLERFPAESQSREDTYLVDPQLRWAVGQGPRGPGPRGEGVPRQPGILDLP